MNLFQRRPVNPPIRGFLPCHIRWMLRRDMAEVYAIEEASFEFPWSPDDFIRCLRQRSCLGAVAEESRAGRIAGYMAYDLRKTYVELLNFAVHPEFRRRGVGTQMIAKLAAKLTEHGRRTVRCNIEDRNLDAQLFFASRGFRAVRVLRSHYSDNGADAYRMLLWGEGVRIQGQGRVEHGGEDA